jgi:hypothetical protein
MEPLFPGMDPYLESPDVWPDFHDSFLAYTRETLQPLLPAGYYAQLRTREEIGIAGYQAERVIYSDVSVRETVRPSVEAGPSAGRSPSGAAVAPEHIVIAADESLEVSFLEIRGLRDDELVTLIELLSPSNKLPGPDREAFERKEREVLSSGTNWVEIDLLRQGRRLACHPRVDLHCKSKGYDYVVVVSRAARRDPLDLEIYGFGVREPLPAVAVPLRPPDADVSLDLGRVFRRAYETGPYGKIVRYDLPADPPLADKDVSWARELVARCGRGRSATSSG